MSKDTDLFDELQEPETEPDLKADHFDLVMDLASDKWIKQSRVMRRVWTPEDDFKAGATWQKEFLSDKDKIIEQNLKYKDLFRRMQGFFGCMNLFYRDLDGEIYPLDKTELYDIMKDDPEIED